jgi:hypothetical protein
VPTRRAAGSGGAFTSRPSFCTTPERLACERDQHDECGQLLARVPNADTVTESFVYPFIPPRDQNVFKREAALTLRETTQAMLTECFVVVRPVRFANPNDPVFRPAIETAKGSLSLTHVADYEPIARIGKYGQFGRHR